MHHEAGNEVNIPAESVQLGDAYTALQFFCCCQGGPKLWATFESIGALPCFYLDEFPGNHETLGPSECRQCRPLSLHSKA